MKHLFALLFLALATQAHAGEFERVHSTAAQLAHSNPGCAAKCGKVFLDTGPEHSGMADEVDRAFAVKAQIVAANPELIGNAGRLVIAHKRSKDARYEDGWTWITPRMIHFAQDDSELALVVAHEIAHAEGIKSERKADARALELMHAAGFDMTAPERLLSRFKHQQRRIAAVRAAIAKL